MKTDPILVFDAGSSSLKASLFAADGAIIDHDEVAYAPTSGPHRLAPEAWWDAAVEAVSHLPPLKLSAIALSGTMENLIAVGPDGAGRGEALLYSDPGGASYCEKLGKKLDAAITGNAAEPLMTAFKLAYLRDTAPDLFAEAACFLPGSKDFLALRLTGRLVTDSTCAATTGLMDIAARDWSEPMLALFGIERNRLPQILAADTVIGPLTEAAADALGLDAGLPVINGCGDGGATTIGSGADRKSDISLYLGTTGWVARVAAFSPGGPVRPFYRLPHPLTGDVIEIAPILSAGAAANWARTSFGLTIAEGDTLALAADAEPGGALFLPYLNGERSPFLDLDLRAGFLGLSTSDGPGELYYAVLEGVAFAIAANIEAMGGLGGGTVSLVGGGALSRIWPQLIADVLAAPITAPSDPVSATAFGAFRIARRALGLDEVVGGFAIVAEPRPERAERIVAQRRRFAAGTAFARDLA
jgi:xylulokinase